MRTVDISGLVSMRKHFQRAAGIAALQAVLLPGLYMVDGVRAGALIPAPVAAAAAVALWRGAFAPARGLSLVLSAFNAILLSSVVFSGAPDGSGDTKAATIFWIAVFLYGSLEAALTSLRANVRRASSSPHVRLVFARRRTVARLYARRAGLPPPSWRHMRPSLALAVILVVGAGFVIPFLAKTWDPGTSVRGVQNVVMLVGGAFLLWVRRRVARRGAEVRQHDPRPPVLLLRSFGDDMLRVGEGARWTTARNLNRRGMTFERVIAEQLLPFGPVIAIGAPGESLAPLGAARDYVSDDSWQDQVQHRMNEAALIVALIGASEGLAWELLRVQRLALLHKLVLVFPPVADVSRRWHALVAREGEAGCSVLPSALEPTRTLALAFDAAGTPIALEGPRGEWSYETAVRLAAVFAQSAGTAGPQPAGPPPIPGPVVA